MQGQSGAEAAAPAGVKPAVSAAAGGLKGAGLVNPRADPAVPAGERMARLLALDNPVEKMTAFMDLLKSLGTNEERAAAMDTLMDGFDPRGRGRELSMLMHTWAMIDPEAAMTKAATIKDWPGSYASYMGLQAWAQRDPQSAVAWAHEHGEGEKGEDGKPNEDGNHLMVGVIAGLVKGNLDQAALLAQNEPRSRARGEMMDKVLDGYFKQRSPEAARDWVTGLPEGAFRDGITRRLTSRLADQDVKSTAQWVENLPAGAARGGAMTEVIDRWSEKNPNEAGTWLGKFPSSPETDDPRQSFAWNIREKDPESALAWAGTLSDEKRQTRLTIDLVRDWMKRDAAGAKTWLESSKLPQDFRARGC